MRQEDTITPVEPGCGLAGLHPELVATLSVGFLFDDILCAMRFEEFTACFVVIECELISQKSEGNVNVASACQPGCGMPMGVRTLWTW